MTSAVAFAAPVVVGIMDRPRPGPPAMARRFIQDGLAGGVGMHRGDKEVHNAKLVLEHFGHGSKRVGAGGHGDHMVPRPIVLGVIHARHEGDVDVV